MDENQMDENRIGRKALDENRLVENWAHDKNHSSYQIVTKEKKQNHVAVISKIPM